jgi:hypothetical protein
VLLGWALAGPVFGADGVIRISSALFDKFAAASQPLTFAREGWYNIVVPTIFGPATFPIYCSMSAAVSNIRLTVVTNSAVLRADVGGTMCGLPYRSSVVSPVVISLDAGTGGLLVRPAGPMNINAQVIILGVTVTVPLSDAQLVPAMTALSIPLDMALIQIETPSGPRTLALVGRNSQLTLHNGYVEIQTDVHFR